MIAGWGYTVEMALSRHVVHGGYSASGMKPGIPAQLQFARDESQVSGQEGPVREPVHVHVTPSYCSRNPFLHG